MSHGPLDPTTPADVIPRCACGSTRFDILQFAAERQTYDTTTGEYGDYDHIEETHDISATCQGCGKDATELLANVLTFDEEPEWKTRAPKGGA
jgi:hypothetical protein